MGFASICTAVYDYQPQSDGELEIREGELLYILEKSDDDDWWKAKKKAANEEEDEPEGLVPFNYVEDAKPVFQARALYDYTRQTDEEVSFSEDAALDIYDTSDPDWTLVHVNGEYGFAPANYIEISESAPKSPSAASNRPAVAAIPRVPEPEQQPSPPASPVRAPQGPAADLARVLGGGVPTSPIASRVVSTPPRTQREFTPEQSDEEPGPALPARPRSQTIPTAPRMPSPDPDPRGVMPSPPHNRVSGRFDSDPAPLRSPGGYHLYNVSEMVSAMGKRKKMPITLGLNIATGTISLSPEKSRDGPTQEWAADKLQHYSIEGKHVFLELIRPSKSLDLHAGAKDTAQEIVAGLGEIAGAHRAEGLKEVITAASGTGQKKGVMLYDFMAQGDDEVTVAEGDEVIVLDDTKSEEWWNVRRVKNGKEGVVPSSYIEVTGTIAAEPPSRTGINAGRSTVEQNRLEEERLAKEAAKANRAQRQAEEARAREVDLPERGSSLGADERRSSKRDKRSGKGESKSRSKPDPVKTRTWTDHSGSFKVDAQFIGVADGKIHLHKVNGVKIAVPVSKMSQTDLEYIEKVMKDSIEDHIPVANLLKMKRKQDTGRSGASVEPAKSQQPKAPEYDWFEFFLSAGVGPHQCERYAQAMVRDSMDESVLPDISMESLRTLGLKEGDALKVMKHLDQRFNRNKANGEGGLFSGPGGALKNNRQRPEADRKVSDKVDPTAFQQNEESRTPTDATATPLTQVPPREAKDGFDDDAWTVKSGAQSAAAPAQQPKPEIGAPAPPPKPSENMQALSLLDKPLEPTPAAPPRPASQPQISQPAQQTVVSAPQQPQQTGATPQFFQQVGQQPTASQLPPQQTGYQLGVPRQRPQAPQQSFTGSALLPPPPRPTSAPQNAQQARLTSQPLQPQLTGVPSNAHPAPPGQSLDDLTAQRIQQYAQLRSQPVGYPQHGFGMMNGMQPQPTGFQQFGQMQQPFLNGNATGSPFGDQMAIAPQPTGYGNFQQQRPQTTGINSFLPPALTPQRTGYQPPNPQMQLNGFNQFQQQPQQTGFQPGMQQTMQVQPTGFQQQMQPQQTGFGQMNGFGNQQVPPVPPIPQQSTPAPLIPQKTGPAPNIRFGVTEAKKLQPQPTGRRANLAAANGIQKT